MASSVTLALWKADQLQRIDIDNVDFESNVETFKNQAVKVVIGTLNNIGKYYDQSLQYENLFFV